MAMGKWFSKMEISTKGIGRQGWWMGKENTHGIHQGKYMKECIKMVVKMALGKWVINKRSGK